MTKTNMLLCGLALIASAPVYSHGQEECGVGNFCNVFEKILGEKGGPFAGFTSGGASVSNLEFQKKAMCELPGSHCTDEQRLGCARISKSVINGVVECWGSNDKNFRLVERVSGNEVSHNSFDVVTNLFPRQDPPLIVAKVSYYSNAVLLNEYGRELANGDSLGCDDFKSAGEGVVACIRRGKSFFMKVEDIEKSHLAYVRTSDISDKIAVDLCAISLNEINDTKKSSNFISRFFSGNSKTFDGIGQGPVEIETHDQQRYRDASATCSISPDEQRCSSILLTKKGLECHLYGSLSYVKTFPTNSDYLTKAAKKYVFSGKEVIPMSEVLGKARSPSIIQVLSPDRLIGSTSFYSSSPRLPSSTQGRK